MAIPSRLPWNLLVLRARRDRGMSQMELAKRVGISQAILSYYERGRVTPRQKTLERLEHALGLPEGELREAVRGAGGSQILAPPGLIQPPRSAFLHTIEAAGWKAETFDQPAGEDGGDLAFAVDLRSHVLLVVIDAEGSGPAAVPSARLAAGCAFGATVSPGGGVPAPEDIVEATVRLWPFLGLPAGSAALCVISFERHGRRIRQCRLGIPPPFLRSGRLSQWTGKPDGPAGAFTGEHTLETDALLVVATDGVAHLPTKGPRPVWNSPELRTMLSRATDPSDVVHLLARRSTARGAGGRADDRLAVAVLL